MTPDDLRRLRGLLARTVSANDHEALSAARAANALLVRAGYTWDMLLDRRVNVLTEVEDVSEAPVPGYRQRYPTKPRHGHERFGV